ncbi:hypothetical protein VIOR3934_21056 [Vibrio orientalis CIP 102891 = ATCC 33934]|uniref:Uncharacterized protein n=1 Tax=Vibrio orientalis CIP 102891 = ATCC 33934 TaxID=675816 RepID=F9SRK7_VIBOR|nr:hypothetical protein VIOR3934_21056 [Vibrio orientalis CIP 102891 = ATCC 33934]
MIGLLDLDMMLPRSIYLTFTLQIMYKIINTDVRYYDHFVTKPTFLVKKTAKCAHYIEQNTTNCYKIVNTKRTHQIEKLHSIELKLLSNNKIIENTNTSAQQV